MGWSRGYRAHAPGLTDDELADLWEAGEAIAVACNEFRRGGEASPERNCVYCARLPVCTGAQQEARPELLLSIKEAFRHDLVAD